jgi:hypothetical protein
MRQLLLEIHLGSRRRDRPRDLVAELFRTFALSTAARASALSADDREAQKSPRSQRWSHATDDLVQILASAWTRVWRFGTRADDSVLATGRVRLGA